MFCDQQHALRSVIRGEKPEEHDAGRQEQDALVDESREEEQEGLTLACEGPDSAFKTPSREGDHFVLLHLDSTCNEFLAKKFCLMGNLILEGLFFFRSSGSSHTLSQLPPVIRIPEMRDERRTASHPQVRW